MPRFLGLIGSLLVHALILQSVLLGTRAQKVHQPDAQGPGATFIKSAPEPAETLILIDLPSEDMRTQALFEERSSAGSAPTNLLVTMISPDPLPHIDIPPDRIDDDTDTPAPVDSGDPAARAFLFGRYSGQIQARIERAWRRPRSPIHADAEPSAKRIAKSPTADVFRCQVRILQDAHGVVQEVQLLDCDGTVAWQKSLVTAILSASPLSAPPDPKVFTQSITMTFEGQAYTPGSPMDDYDIEH